ncbi:MAG: hypothetical protein FLDDKLPJ_02146 [Phycisphaerae bacterium]|nr:hypothetical protein [Phycisphaerae bacterium]
MNQVCEQSDSGRKAAGAAPPGSVSRGVAVGVALLVGVAVLVNESAKLGGRAPAGAQWAAMIGPADVLLSPSLESVSSEASASSFIIFALPGLVVVALVTVLVGHRRASALRTARVGGLYGP